MTNEEMVQNLTNVLKALCEAECRNESFYLRYRYAADSVLHAINELKGPPRYPHHFIE